MSLDFTDDQSTLVQVMAWCHQATSHYLNQCWPRSLPPYGVTRQQLVTLVYTEYSFCLYRQDSMYNALFCWHSLDKTFYPLSETSPHYRTLWKVVFSKRFLYVPLFIPQTWPDGPFRLTTRWTHDPRCFTKLSIYSLDQNCCGALCTCVQVHTDLSGTGQWPHLNYKYKWFIYC